MTLVGIPVSGSLSLKWATILRSVPNLSSHMVEVVLRTEYGRSSSPIIRLIKLLFPELVSPGNENTEIMDLTFVFEFSLPPLQVKLHPCSYNSY